MLRIFQFVSERLRRGKEEGGMGIVGVASGGSLDVVPGYPSHAFDLIHFSKNTNNSCVVFIKV